MAVNKKLIQQRIKSVKNTRKITKAMELVSAAKMKRATEAVVGSRPYVSHLRELVAQIGSTSDISAHPLLKEPEEMKKVLLVLMMSDRGLCGGYNVSMERAVRQWREDLGSDVEVEVVTMGKRAAVSGKRLGMNVVESYVDVTNNPNANTVSPVIKTVMDRFLDDSYSHVFLAYTDFKSAISQIPTIMKLLPTKDLGEGVGIVSENAEAGDANKDGGDSMIEFKFEPSPAAVLNSVLPRIVESVLFQALLEAAASEHSARMVAMKSASDNAMDMIDSLTLTYNQARQAGITQEIAEISSGKAALE